VHEGIEQALIDAGERAMDRETLTLEPLGRGGDGDDPTLHSLGAGCSNAWQGGDVVDGDGWHVGILGDAVAARVGSTGLSVADPVAL